MKIRLFFTMGLALATALLTGCATFTLAGVDERETPGPSADKPASPSDDEAEATAEPQLRGEVVVLIHGMMRSPLSMKHLESFLAEEGYDVYNWGYSSTCCSIAELGEQLQKDLAEFRKSRPGTVHFVGHSLGNIIIRWALTQGTPPDDVGQVVMLAPPNQGSSMADVLTPYLGEIIKPIAELQTDAESTAKSLPEIENATIGVIAGKYDDKVSIEESHLKEEDDHIVVPAFHSFLMWREDVQQQVLTFLEEGKFEHEEND
ncbi:MAG: hypothetical protein WEB58_18160 [Planctomycetaceae bacterium]